MMVPPVSGSPSHSARLKAQLIECKDLTKVDGPISTGIGFLDHMLDQYNSHAQIGVSLTITSPNESAVDLQDRNRHAATCDQEELFRLVGTKLGLEFKRLLLDSPTAGTFSRFCCPLDEALVACTLQRVSEGQLALYTLAPYGKFPLSGRKYIGSMQTAPLQLFWQSMAAAADLRISLEKVRGDNAHHIVESSFKAFARALRNLLDGTSTDSADSNHRMMEMYGLDSVNWRQGLEMGRQGTVTRKTKETSISTTIQLDGGQSGVNVDTGIKVLDEFLRTFAIAALISLDTSCQGDLWIDEHHTVEDVAIAIGQVLNQALGTKAGLNRMWCAIAEQGDAKVEVTMDLSNRPCLTHNLTLDQGGEKVGDLSLEMFEHMLDSLVVNSRMTVHIVEVQASANLHDTVQAVAIALGQALKYCSMIDCRRSGATASSKGTLSV